MQQYLQNKKGLVQGVFDKVFDKYDLMNDFMSFGIHRVWKNDLMFWMNPGTNKILLDVACGTGDLAKLFHDKTKNLNNAICIDPNEGMINIGKKKLRKYKNIKSYDLQNSLPKPLPGKKIIKAFNYGLSKNKLKYDFIGKFDGDLILPKNYFEILINEFKINNKLGLASGVIASMVNEKWLIENMYDKDHVRGGIKFYSKEAFKEINGLKESIGWDTLDEMQLKYFRYEIKVFKNIITNLSSGFSP